MQNQPLQPNQPETGQVPGQSEQQKPQSPEVTQAPEVKPEQQTPVETTPETQQGVTAAPAQPQVDPVQTQPQQPVQNDQPVTDEEGKQMEKIDERWVKAADDVIDKYEDKPFEEEEAHEDVQIKYLWKRFKKKLGKSED